MWFVAEIEKSRILANSNITPKELIADLKVSFGEKISYQSAHRAKKIVLEEKSGDELESYQLIDSFCNRVESFGGFVDFTILQSGHFEAVFICPKPLREAFFYLRPLVF